MRSSQQYRVYDVGIGPANARMRRSGPEQSANRHRAALRRVRFPRVARARAPVPPKAMPLPPSVSCGRNSLPSRRPRQTQGVHKYLVPDTWIPGYCQSDAGLRSYLVVTGGYWAFTVTDGAIRMLVVLYFHLLGYSPFEVAGTAGIPVLGTRLELHPGRQFPGTLGDRLRCRAGCGTTSDATQSSRPGTRRQQREDLGLRAGCGAVVYSPAGSDARDRSPCQWPRGGSKA